MALSGSTDFEPKEGESIFPVEELDAYLSLDSIGLSDKKVETRPLVIGYLSDVNKDELNPSKGMDIDEAHVWCKKQQAEVVKSLSSATKLILIGFSFSDYDKWVQEAIYSSNSIKKVYVASGETTTQKVICKIKKGNMSLKVGKWKQKLFLYDKKRDIFTHA